MFEWTQEQDDAFRHLKEMLISAPVAPVLGMPTDTGTFYLDCDASDVGLGAVLSEVLQHTWCARKMVRIGFVSTIAL